ncbi:MAG: DUF1329 domain-containing protein [Deltaproteobacteria bacterium]|nr:DUF1329 domain-containing protein [Deltaproteobacteria bacterium]
MSNRRMKSASLGVAMALLLGAALAAHAQEDAEGMGPSFKEGDIITYDGLAALRPYLPDEFWNNRDFFFYEGMQLEIGPFHRDYSGPDAYKTATEKFKGQSRIGPDNSLESYTVGRPFPMEEIDCTGDPQAGVKIMWNFDYTWTGAGGNASFYYSYWDRGEELPLYYEGVSKTVVLSHRIEPQYEKTAGDVFRNEKRKNAFGVDVTAPFDARGIMLMSYRYKSTDKARSEAKNDDTWVYVPTLRRVRRISTAQRTDSISGTDFTFDDLRSFAGIVPQYDWECLGELEMIAPSNTKVKGYPYEKEHNFGPYGLSFADDRWEMRRVLKVRMVPKNADHPYHHKDLYIDKQTLSALYSFAYDQKEELWKIIWHNKRWSEDELTEGYYPGWEGVPNPRSLALVSDIITNVQTGTGNRIEFWDAEGVPFKSKGKIRRYIDVGRLTKGR